MLDVRRCMTTVVTKRLLAAGGTAVTAAIVSASSCRLTDNLARSPDATGLSLRWFTPLAEVRSE